jgi:hypothetical protein
MVRLAADNKQELSILLIMEERARFCAGRPDILTNERHY